MIAEVVNKTKTMSSLQFAELTGTRHANVKRSITALKKRGEIAITQSELLQSTNNGGYKKIVVYHLNEADSYSLMLHLSPAFRSKLAKFWEKEQKHTKPSQTSTQQIEGNLFAERFAANNQAIGLRDVTTALKANERRFTEWLVKDKHCYRADKKGRPLRPRKKHVDADLMVLTPIVTEYYSGFQMKFTPKGVVWICQKWMEYLNTNPHLVPDKTPVHLRLVRG